MAQPNFNSTKFTSGGTEIPTTPVSRRMPINPGGEGKLAKFSSGVARKSLALPRSGNGYRGRPSTVRKRNKLLAMISVLWAILVGLLILIIAYAFRPMPLPELLAVGANYAPHYLFSIYGVDQPVGVAYSPKGDRIYVAESGGEHMVKIYNRRGDLLGSFAPPRTELSERSPVYISVDKVGRVYISDILQLAVHVYDADGVFLDSIIGPDLTLSEYVSMHTDGIQDGTALIYNVYQSEVYYTTPGGEEQQLPGPGPLQWAPLGVRFNSKGDLLLTDIFEDDHSVRIIPESATKPVTWRDFNPPEVLFGRGNWEGGGGNFSFPNVAVADSKGRIYVTDGNNSRISVWDGQGGFLFNFGRGSGDSAINLPRGAAIDKRDHLYVVDAVDHSVKVYDVSGDEVAFLYRFGDYGAEEGQFNYPNDIALDETGRLYIADRENNRIQVWSY